MPFVFALIGALLGATMAGVTGALVGLVAAPTLLMLFRQMRKSDAPETAVAEISLWFPGEDIATYDRANDRWIFE